MKKLTLFILILSSLTASAQKRQGWQFAIEQQVSVNSQNETYNDTGNVVDILFVSRTDSTVKMWYRIFDSTSNTNYTEPRNEVFPTGAFVWLVLTDIDTTYIDTLNKYIFKSYGIKAVRRYSK